MRFFITLQMAVRALRRNTMRSILTALGIIIGVAAVIAMVSIGNGAKAQVQAAIASLGDNLVLVSPYVIARGQILANGLNWGTQVYGVSPDFPVIRSWRVSEGVFFEDPE